MIKDRVKKAQEAIDRVVALRKAAKALVEKGHTIVEVSEMLNVSPATIRLYVK